VPGASGDVGKTAWVADKTPKAAAAVPVAFASPAGDRGPGTGSETILMPGSGLAEVVTGTAGAAGVDGVGGVATVGVVAAVVTAAGAWVAAVGTVCVGGSRDAATEVLRCCPGGVPPWPGGVPPWPGVTL